MKTLFLEDYTISPGKLTYRFLYDRESYFYVVESPYIENLEEHLIANIGLSLSPYFFNLDRLDTIHINFSEFQAEQLQFFEQYLLHGMAEFNYVNNFDIDKATRVIARKITSSKSGPIHKAGYDHNSKILLMLGGGKDSLVSQELLSAANQNFDYFTVNANIPSLNIVNSGEPQSQLINIACVSEQKLKDNARYKGHKPGSSIWAFLSLIPCFSGSYDTVISSNEYSANFPQIIRNDGIDINHQYTKSFDFEINFQNYANKYLMDGYHYFSLLRPLYELQIAKIFVLFGKHFDKFISCNITHKENKWCKQCAKCAFVYTILAPFLSEDQVVLIWEGHVLEEAEAAKHIYNLISKNTSPLECIGTWEETVLALYLLVDKHGELHIHKSYRDKILKIVKGTDIRKLNTLIFGTFHREHNIPQQLFDKLDFNRFLK